MKAPSSVLPWLANGATFPPVEKAWGPADPAPGLLAAGDRLDAEVLLTAYARGIFPWYSAGQPVLWWSPDPRMVLRTDSFKLHRSLRKTIARFRLAPGCQVTMDRAFDEVIATCAQQPRPGQDGTWIVPGVVEAYTGLHRRGFAHSVETWVDGRLAGGLYCVNLGGMVFGESMFAHQSDASKIALAALVAFCRDSDIDLIDCQQNTSHLASLGATEISRQEFCRHVEAATPRPLPNWQFADAMWEHLFLPQAATVR